MPNLGIVATVTQHDDGPGVVLEPLPQRGTGNYRLSWNWRGKQMHRYFHTNDPRRAAHEQQRAACALAAGNRPKPNPRYEVRPLDCR